MLTAEQLIAREKFIGSSDVSAILGLNPYASAEDVRLAKCGKLESWAGNDATRAGNYLEPACIAWASDQLGRSLGCDKTFIHANGFMGANVDACGLDDEERGFVVEAKTSGIVGEPIGDFGAAGTDEVPSMYYVQVQHQLACTGFRKAYLAALIGGRGFVMYEIPRHEEMIRAIETKCVHFWNEYVLKDKSAPNCVASLEVARRIKRQPGVVVNIAEHACDELAKAIAARKAAQDIEDAAKSKLLTLAEGADAIRRGMDSPEIFATNNPNKRGVRSLRLKGEL